MKLPFTIYDLRFTISNKSDRAVDPLIGAHGGTCPNCQNAQVAFNPNSEVETAWVAVTPGVAARPKAVLKPTPSRRWREFRCGHANAERLDCGRLIAAFPPQAQRERRPTSEFGFNRQSAIANRKWEQGIALVITLIMLAVTLVMAVAFLALARRERGSVTTTTDTTTARLAAETAVANAQAQIVANMLGGVSNAYNLSLLVSTNYINPLGFTTGSGNPTNVNFDHLLNSATPLSQDQFCQNVSNLFFLPRVPVLIATNLPTSPLAYDFRYFLDLNENARFEPNGWITNVDANNNILLNPPVTGNPVVTFQTGDPEWVGVLEHPDAPHGPNNHFLSRYAFFAVPAGNALDINYIHNQALNPINPALNTSDGYMRNQGVGSWEINLAAFLADLNTNIWSPVALPANLYYAYNEPANFNSGVAFDDARALLAYRYNFNSLSNANTVFLKAATTFPNDGIDDYSRGPLQTTLDTNVDFLTPTINTSLPWSGADNPTHFFTINDFLNPVFNLGQFTNRLRNAGSAVDTYDRYTYYRMLDQLGTDSSPDDGKLNLNYSNAVVTSR